MDSWDYVADDIGDPIFNFAIISMVIHLGIILFIPIMFITWTIPTLTWQHLRLWTIILIALMYPYIRYYIYLKNKKDLS